VLVSSTLGAEMVPSSLAFVTEAYSENNILIVMYAITIAITIV
jgi:hypothetical protein